MKLSITDFKWSYSQGKPVMSLSEDHPIGFKTEAIKAEELPNVCPISYIFPIPENAKQNRR